MKKTLAIVLCLAMIISTFCAVPVFADSTTTIENYNDRVETLFNNDWHFYRETYAGNSNTSTVAAVKAKDATWEDISLPHDFSIETPFSSVNSTNRSGCLLGGTGWYKKSFQLPSELSSKTIVLNFDGSYINTVVFINGTQVGTNSTGYTAFAFDITKYLKFGFDKTNEIYVKVSNTIPSERWYSGSGIYRDVTMIITDPVHVSYRGTSVSMPNLASTNGVDGTLSAAVSLTNDSSASADVSVKTTIVDNNKNEVGSSDTATTTVAANSKASVTLAPSLQNPNLWSPKTPNLYTLHTEVSIDSNVVDTYETTFGYKWTVYDGTSGFFINGQPMKLKGAALHNDLGASVGTASHDDAIKRYIDNLVYMGCNAIRTAHQTLSENLMNYCAQKGVMVFDEMFDEWLHAKCSDSNSYNGIFATAINTSNPLLLVDEMGTTDISSWSTATTTTWAEFMLKSTMMRDRNNPAVIIWGLGNELFQSNGVNTDASKEKYPLIAKSLVQWVHETDPQSRPATIGDNRTEADGTVEGNSTAREYLDKIQAEMDITGINYDPSASSWDYLHEVSPTKAVFNTEAVDQCSDRGEYSHSKAILDKTNPENYVFSSYNNDDRGWAEYLGETWNQVLTRDWQMGQFIWAGIDYLGEPCDYNLKTGLKIPNTTFCGAFDSAGFAKDSMYFYRSIWNDDDYTAHMLPGTWNEDELEITNGYVPVCLYSNTDKIEVYLNGKLIAYTTATVEKTSSSDATNYYSRKWTPTIVDSTLCNVGSLVKSSGNNDFTKLFTQLNVKYEAGELSIKSYEKQDDDSYKEITTADGTQSVKTNTGIEKLNIEQSKTTTVADEDNIVYYEVNAQTNDNEFVNGFNGKVEFTLEGAGEIVGADNGSQIRTDRGCSDEVVSDNNKTATTTCYNGKALIAVRALNTTGNISVSATAYDGTDEYKATANTVTSTLDTVADEFEEEIEQHTHTNTTVVTPPTCTEQGYTTYTCSVCGEVSIGDYTPALGHTLDADGNCTVCGKTANQLEISNIKNYVNNNPCDTTYSYDIDTTGSITSDKAYCMTMTYDNKIRIISNGIRDYCPNNYVNGQGITTYNDDYCPKYNLNGDAVNSFDLEDEESNYYFQIDSDNSTMKAYTYIDGVKNYIMQINNWSFGFTTSTDEATEFIYTYYSATNAYSAYYVGDDSKKYYISIRKCSYTDRVNNSWVVIGGVLRIMPVNSLSYFKLFNITGDADPDYYINLNKAINSGAEAADNNSSIADNIVENMRTALSLYKSGPSVANEEDCNTTSSSIVSSLHTCTWDDGTVTTPSTCITHGILTYHCTFSGCTNTKTEEIPLADHTYGAASVTTEPTCTDDGVGIHTCTICSHQENIVIPATGNHNFVDGVCTVCGLNEEDNSEGNVCYIVQTGVKYATLINALDAVQTNQSIRLYSDAEINYYNGSNSNFNNKSFTIDLNNHKIITVGDRGLSLVNAGANYTITFKDGSITNSSGSGKDGLLWLRQNCKYIFNNINLELVDGTTVGSYVSSLITCHATGASADFEDCTIKTPSSYLNANLWSYSQVPTLTFKNTTVSSYVDIFSNSNSTVTSGTFNMLGGAVFATIPTISENSEKTTDTTTQLVVSEKSACEHNFVDGFCTICGQPEHYYNVSVDDATTSIANFTSLELPASTVDGFVAYTDGTNYYAAGDTVIIDKDYTFTSVSLSFSMSKGAAMRYNDPTGMRFYSNVDTDLIEKLESAGADIQIGTIFSLKSIIGNQDFTMDMTGKYVEASFNTRNWYTDNSGFKGVVGSIVTIKDANVNAEFVGRGYIKISFLGNSKTIYANYPESKSENNTRTICWIANQLMLTNTEAVSEDHQIIVKRYADLYNGLDRYDIFDPSDSDKFD